MSHGRKERNVLFNNTLNTFYLRLYGISFTWQAVSYIYTNINYKNIHIFSSFSENACVVFGFFFKY